MIHVMVFWQHMCQQAMYDTMSYSFKEGKSFVVIVMKKNHCLQLTIFEDTQAELDDIIRVGKQCMCRLYGSKTISTCDVRHQ